MNEEKVTAGEGFVKMLRPVGCVVFLILAVAVTVLCFTAGSDPIRGYEAPEDTVYYAAHLEDLQAELEANVFPHLEGVLESAVTGDKVTVTVAEDHFAVTRSAILRYFDESLLEIVSE